MKEVYLIKNIEEYGKLIAYCIHHDISVFRTYWDERAKGDRCYYVDFNLRRCLYSSAEYWKSEGYKVIEPEFYFNEYGFLKLRRINNYVEN